MGHFPIIPDDYPGVWLWRSLLLTPPVTKFMEIRFTKREKAPVR